MIWINKNEENDSLCFLINVTVEIRATGKQEGPDVLKRLLCIAGRRMYSAVINKSERRFKKK
jgi:hypothetical protein